MEAAIEKPRAKTIYDAPCEWATYLVEQINKKAYALWKQRGCREGHALEDWLDAERVVMGTVEGSLMKIEEAERLREEWERKGNPPCQHSRLAKEYYFDSDTEDEVCVTCGKIWQGGRRNQSEYHDGTMIQSQR